MMGEIKNPDLHQSSELPDIEIIFRISVWHEMGKEGRDGITAEKWVGDLWAIRNVRQAQQRY